MAATGGESRDKYDMHQNIEAWDAFLKLSKWVAIGCVIVLVFMAMFLTGGNPPPIPVGAH